MIEVVKIEDFVLYEMFYPLCLHLHTTTINIQ